MTTDGIIGVMEALEALDGTTPGYGTVVSAGAAVMAVGDGTILTDGIIGDGADTVSAGTVHGYMAGLAMAALV